MTLQEKIAKLAQFPHKERTQPYQSYFMKGVGYINGTRNTLYRYDVMRLPALFNGASVLDLGCQLGAMSIEAVRRGAAKVLGLEYEKDFIACAVELAKYNEMPIVYKQADLKNTGGTIDTVNNFFGRDHTISIVFALSLTKHVGTPALYHILRNLKWKYCFVEGHNCNGDLDTPHCRDIQQNLTSRFSNILLGFTDDRSIRPVWRLEQQCKSN